MQITKDMLPNIDRVCLALENCEDYNIKSEDIIDIWFDEQQPTPSNAWYDCSTSNDGRLVISKNAFKQLSSFAYNKFADGTTALDYEPEENFYLFNRLTKWQDRRKLLSFQSSY